MAGRGITRGTLIDANLLCLLVVGRTGIAGIADHPRLRIFAAHDFEILTGILDRIGTPILCPHILAETANLLFYQQSPAQQRRWRQSLADVIALFEEENTAAVEAVADPGYARFGLTDAVLLLLAANRDLVLVSDDLKLCLEAEKRRLRTVNYNYLRDGAMSLDDL